MIRQDRVIDINRYKKYREKGRISPRGNSSAGSSVGTASLSTSPVSFSSSFFGSSKSEDEQDSRAAQITLNEKSLGHNTNGRDVLEKTRRQLQSKVERNRKLEKFEKFKRAKKTFELKKKLMEISYPSDPSITQLSQVSATKIGHTLGSSSYTDSVPKRITIVGSPSLTAKENQSIFAGSRQPVDPPRTVLQIATNVLTPQKAPTPRSKRNSTPQRKIHSTIPIDPPRNIFHVATHLLTPRKAPTPRQAQLNEKRITIPVDPPRNASLIVTQALTPRKAPTPRRTPLMDIQPTVSSDAPTLRTPQTPRAAPLTPSGFDPLNLPSMKEIKKQVEERYDQIKREPPAQNVSTTSPEEKVSRASRVESQKKMESSPLHGQNSSRDSLFPPEWEESGILKTEDQRFRVAGSVQSTFCFDSTVESQRGMESSSMFSQESSKDSLFLPGGDQQVRVASSVQSTLGSDSTTSPHQHYKGRDIINVEEMRYSVPTTLVADPYQRRLEGSEEQPICIEEEIIDLSDAVEPPSSPKTFSKPPPLQIEDKASKLNLASMLACTSFDYTFSPKIERPQSTKYPQPSVRFDFTPSNVDIRPKSTSIARTGTKKFSFSTPSPVTRPQVMTTPSTTTKRCMERSQSASRLHDKNAYSGLLQSFASNENFSLIPKRQANFQFTKTPEGHTRQSGSETKESKMVMLSPESQSRLYESLSTSHSGFSERSPTTIVPVTETTTPSSEIARQSRSIVHHHASIRERFEVKRGLQDPQKDQVKHSNLLIKDKRPATPSRFRQNALVLTTGSEQRASDKHSHQGGSLQTVDSETAQRTARMVYAQDFYRMIQKQKLRDRFLNKGRSARKRQRCGGNGVSFVVRKRPIMEGEIDIGEYDVVNTETNDDQAIIVYETKVLSDLKAKELVPHSFRCNQIISDLQTTDDLYTRVAQPLVDLAYGGGFATIVMCGTDGSGKNENRDTIEAHVANDIFVTQSEANTVTVQYVELCGKNCYDLLSPGSFVQVIDKEGGYFQLEGAKTETVHSGHEMLRMFSNAKRRLAARRNLRKQKDEKSFVLCQIWIRQLGSRPTLGCLTLLECPVSEFDGVWVPTVDTTKAKTTFNALMQCISAKISRRTITNPFRNINNLTKLMKESFESKESRVCVLASISPLATDTESTITTLSSMSNVMRGSKPSHRASQAGNLQIQNSAVMLQDENLILPRQWTNKQLMEWMAKKNLFEGPIPSHVNGRVAMRLTKQQLNQTCYYALDIGKASKLYDALRSENDRIARLRVKRRMSVSMQEYNNS